MLKRMFKGKTTRTITQGTAPPNPKGLHCTSTTTVMNKRAFWKDQDMSHSRPPPALAAESYSCELGQRQQEDKIHWLLIPFFCCRTKGSPASTVRQIKSVEKQRLAVQRTVSVSTC